MSEIGVGIVGLGNVGSGTLRVLHENAKSIAGKLGFPLKVRALCSRSVEKAPPVEAGLHPEAFRTRDWRELVARPDVAVVAELVGGTTDAKQIVEAAVDAGKSVVTANKELIAEAGAALWSRAAAGNARLAMEAAVAGGIPILTALREGIAGDRIEALMGILNGTSNFILTEMERRGEPLETILKEAQTLGYAESDPSADIDGFDARSKLAILAVLAFGMRVDPRRIPVEGIRRIGPIDFTYADRLGHTVRLTASARDGAGGLRLRVGPALIRKDTILASVMGSYNAVWVRGRHGEDTFYYGRGAGPEPTGVAVVSDLMAAARGIAAGAPAAAPPFAHRGLAEYDPAPAGDEESRHYLRFRVRDRPGIIAELAAILAEHRIGVDAVLQEPRFDKRNLPFVITVEAARREAIDAATAQMSRLDFLLEKPLALPLESGLAAS